VQPPAPPPGSPPEADAAPSSPPQPAGAPPEAAPTDAPPPPPSGSPVDVPPPPEAAGEEGTINLNEASFEQLRDAGLSVTQTGRVLAHRERGGGFRSLDELDEIPGFSQDFLDRIKSRLTV
jgi:DNA uptake protein ComE-like DNA-binding protein